MRGEYLSATVPAEAFDELPPRARRIPPVQRVEVVRYGTTSACAENTTPDPLNAKTHGNYLRVRGEYRTCGACERFCGELPPRARRIHCVRESIRVKTGTTSACAENTGRYSCWSSRIRNYLRVRGEYPISRNRKGSLSELPPRARRIHERDGWAHVLRGTTSACAENTWRAAQRDHDAGNYLRVRGEYRLKAGVIEKIMELPPRARRIHHHRPQRRPLNGTTSACAENTPPPTAKAAAQWNYLRVRGEYDTGVRFM